MGDNTALWFNSLSLSECHVLKSFTLSYALSCVKVINHQRYKTSIQQLKNGKNNQRTVTANTKFRTQHIDF